MAEKLTDVDVMLLDRWADTVGIWQAISDLEERMAERLEAVAEGLRSWLEARGYLLLDVDRKYAAVNVGKHSWMTKKNEPLIYISLCALYPFDYRKVDEDHPYVWVQTDGLTREAQEAFKVELANRVDGKPGGWINKDCDRYSPVGRYIHSYGDAERAQLAQSLEAMEAFIKAELEPMLALGPDIDAALQAVK